MSEAALYVELVPTTKGIKRTIEKDLTEPMREAEGRTSGFFGAIGKGVKGVATGVVGLFATVSGMAVAGGISRLLNIEDAQAKLRGLGHDATAVTAIMGNALDAVRGTAFGMDEAATTAASAVASGIKPGQELTKYLKLTADAATIAGVSLSEMGGIINKVTANGKAMTENLYQLQDRGIPIMQWLAAEYGVTAEELSKMVSRGEVDAETFRRVIEENIGGAALASGDTTRGAFANMLASLSRVGANLLQGVFPLFKDTFQGITDILAPMEAVAKSAGETIGAVLAPAFQALIGAVQLLITGDFTSKMGQLTGWAEDSTAVDKILSFRDGLSDITAVLGPLTGAFIALGAGGLGAILSKIPLIGGLAGPLAALGGPLGIILGAFAGLLAVSPELQSALGGTISTVFQTLVGVGERLAPVFQALMPLLAGLAQLLAGVLADAVVMLAPFLQQLVLLLGDALATILPVIIPIVAVLAQVISQVATALMPVVSVLLSALMPIFQALVPVIATLVTALAPLITTLVSALAPIITTVAQLLGPLLTPILELVMQVVKALTPVIKFLVEAAINILIGALEFLMPVIQGVVKGISSFLIPVIQTITDVLKGLIDFFVNVFTGNWEGAWKSVEGIVQSAGKGMWNIIKGAINGMIDLLNGFLNGINGVGSWLSDISGGSINFKVGNIPHLAAGAYVTATPGGRPAVIGEGRYDEVVMPLGGAQLEKIRAALGSTGDGARVLYVVDQDGNLIGRMRVEARGEIDAKAQDDDVVLAGGKASL